MQMFWTGNNLTSLITRDSVVESDCNNDQEKKDFAGRQDW
jgi:hypothetical protein